METLNDFCVCDDGWIYDDYYYYCDVVVCDDDVKRIKMMMT